MRFADLTGRRILVDTNVLNTALTSRKTHELYKQFPVVAANNELSICDTVYYEFLRNCSLATYRDRVKALNNIKPAIKILRENDSYFHTIWCLYMYALRNDPKKILSIEHQDIFIAACAIGAKIDAVLTENYRDFPSEIFTKTELTVSTQITLYLMEFKRVEARNLWNNLASDNYKFEINMVAFK